MVSENKNTSGRGVPKNEKPPKPKPKPKPEKKPLTAEEVLAIWKKARKDAYDEKKEIWNKYDSFIHSASYV
ncbi:hypothetical protein KD923_14715 [Escherichia fergusonii]|nr:hypothetical protein [Escherichia fergusonii]MCH5361429.1 hypothetical protein [Escherichia fergusonii]